MLVRIYLFIVAALFAVFGLYAFVDPIGMAAGLGIDVSGPNGAYELRGIYGGISLATALLCAAGALQEGMRRPALWFLVTYMGGYVFARAAALLLGPPPTLSFLPYVAFETICLLLAIASLRTFRGR